MLPLMQWLVLRPLAYEMEHSQITRFYLKLLVPLFNVQIKHWHIKSGYESTSRVPCLKKSTILIFTFLKSLLRRYQATSQHSKHEAPPRSFKKVTLKMTRHDLTYPISPKRMIAGPCALHGEIQRFPKISLRQVSLRLSPKDRNKTMKNHCRSTWYYF